MARHTRLQLIDIVDSRVNEPIVGLVLSKIPRLFDMVYPADGVDNIKQTINGSHEAFELAYDHNFINNSLTRLSSFLGLPNQQLHKGSPQSLRNLLENFSGGFDVKSDKTNAIMIPLNILLTPLKFLLNVIKLITEFIPAILFMVVMLSINKIMRSIINHTENALGRLRIKSGFIDILKVFYFLLLLPIMITPAIIYLCGCCLTSSYESIRAAWHFGAALLKNTKAFGYVFVAIIMAITIVLNIFALPWAVKFLTITFLPVITPYLPHVIATGLDKIGAVIKPVLAVIGDAVAPILKYTKVILPEFVGAGLFGTIIRSLVSPLISYGFDKLKEWWNKPKVVEQTQMDQLNQQSKMLCDLGALQEQQPAVELHEVPNIINGYVAHEEGSQLNLAIDNPSQPLLASGLNNLPQPVEGSREEINNASSEYSLKPLSAASSSLFPHASSLKPPAASGQSQNKSNNDESILRDLTPS